ncbi:uncharacterized protein N7459_006006 [Penicillium hispanicum]|uniref:uncharacterized protein n=1 Tax=Penicillium hispanicum TaxID=1080232 RepID=UPI00254211E2|nr:uncharacterized protein N7459_006006 [Penicillium hispanicum]KAJ5580021.1 hypothetical protein N7459_006006 [Penicillium hispanicum]
METSAEATPAHQLTIDVKPTQPGPLECTVHNLTAKIFLNRPAEDLVPARYLRRAERTPTVQRKAWVFRNGAEDAHHVDLNAWSKVDIRYRGVFKTLAKVPCFSKCLWDGGCEDCQQELDDGRPSAQAQVIYALMNEVGDMLDLQRPTKNGDAIFELRPRLLSCHLEYWTGYREKHKDGPYTAGFLSLEYDPDEDGTSIPLLPVSTTVEEESLPEALNGKFKLILGQLLMHLRPLPLPADKLPDQEIFLVGLHGSKLHIMRAFFPGQKMSSILCRRDVPGPSPVFHSQPLLLPAPLAPRPQNPQSPPSPKEPYATHIEDCDSAASHPNRGTRAQEHAQDQVPTKDTASPTPTAPAAPTSHETAPTHPQGNESSTPNPEIPRHPHFRAGNSARFYTAENIERLRLHLDALKLRTLDDEPHPRTSRTRARSASSRPASTTCGCGTTSRPRGHARCGALQETFLRHPVRRENERGGTGNAGSGGGTDSDSDSDFYCESALSLEERDARLQAEVEREERKLAKVEIEMREAEARRRVAGKEAVRVREAMRFVDKDDINPGVWGRETVLVGLRLGGSGGAGGEEGWGGWGGDDRGEFEGLGFDIEGYSGVR